MKGTSARGFPLVRLLLPLILVGCAETATTPETIEVASGPARELALFTCQASVEQASVACEVAAPGSAGGVSLDQRTMGGQHRYVALASSSVTYEDEIFEFETTVRNLLTLPMSTADGESRSAQGVRIFFHELPTATSGSGAISLANATGTDIFTAADQPYFQYGGSIDEEEQDELGADGILESGEVSAPMAWRLNVPPTVDTFTFSVLVATETPSGTLTSIAPQVTSVSPAVLVPGTSATIVGTGFAPAAGDNSVMIGGLPAFITGGTPTSLTVTVPCMLSGSVQVTVSRDGVTGAGYQQSIVVPKRTVLVGEMIVVDDLAEVGCNELSPAGGPARYIVSVFSNSTSPASNSAYRFSADMGGADELQSVPEPTLQRLAPGGPSLTQFVADAQQQLADDQHERLLDQNRQFLETYGAGLRDQPGRNVGTVGLLHDVSPNRSFRIPNINGSLCQSFYLVDATRVYLDGKIAIYEDDALSAEFKAANSATMAQNYQRIGDQFNEDMEPIINEYFGDVLRRDSLTDDNGVIIVLVTPRLNASFSGVAGFVTSCDLFANDDTSTPAVGGPYTGEVGSVNASSNHGEIFYAYAPTVNAAGFTGNTPESWYRTIRSTFIHETKHLASYTARVANGASSYEHTWLEEATARHSEELWGRLAVDDLGWKGNNGYGSAEAPGSIYCDLRPDWPACNANSRRPASIMQRHFTSLYTFLFGQNARLLSPFGATASDNASYYYAVGWSLVRYAADRHAVDEVAFFQALNQSSQTGVTNLLARTGTDLDRLLAGWTLALAVDDHPLHTAAPSADLQFATWNFRNIYAGLNGDLPGTYSLAYPLLPSARAFGSSGITAIATLRGGGALWYEFSGEQTGPQLIRLEGPSWGAAIPSALRLAITRVE